jgi:tetratricopeptide (TPR) repeat protein
MSQRHAVPTQSDHSQHAPSPQGAAHPLASRAAEAIGSGDYKQAIELYKRLVKQDARSEWQDALAEAYAGRARMLAAKGLFEEAETALLKSAGPDGMVRDPLLYAQCLVKRGQLQKAAEHAVKYVATDRVPSVSAPQFAELAAALSLAVPVVLDPPAEPQSERGKWIEHAAAARQSLAAWSEGRPAEQIDLQLARIPLRSAFRALRLIIKSLITAPDDPARARQLLDGVSADSPFASLRLAVEAALPGAPAEPPAGAGPSSRAQQLFTVEVKGLSGAASQAVAQLAKAERQGPGALLSFLLNQRDTLPAEDIRKACLNLLPQAPDRLRAFESAFGPLSEFDTGRILAVAAEGRKEWDKAERYWCKAAQSVEHALDEQARLTAGVIYRHLADLTEQNPDIFDLAPCDDVCIDYLEQSLGADPDYLPAVLQLIDLYRKAGRDKDWHRQADEAAERFPEQSAVLLQAMDSAIARKAYKKAAGFARRVLALDPINQAARERMIELQILHAHRQTKSKRADLASKELAAAAEWERPDAPSARLRINQGLVKAEIGPVQAGEAELREGVALMGGGVAGWLFASLEHMLMGRSEATAALLRRELVEAQKAAPTKKEIRSIASAVSIGELRDFKKKVAGLVFRIRGWLLKGSGLEWTAAEFSPIADMLQLSGAYDLLGDYARQASRHEPEEESWRYYRIIARTKGDPARLSHAEENELVDMMEDAARRDDFHAANRIRRFMEDGGSAERGGRKGRRFSLLDVPESDDDVDLDVDDDTLLGQLLAASLSDLPPEAILRLVKQVGKEQAATIVAERLKRSELGPIIPRKMRRDLAAAIVDSVVATGGRAIHG